MPQNIGVIVNGGLVLRPSVLPEIDTSAMVPSGPSVAPPPLFLGVSEGGDPTRVYNFRNFDDAKKVIRNGEILSHIARAFNPSPDKANAPGAMSIKFIRCSSAAARAAYTINPPTSGV